MFGTAFFLTQQSDNIKTVPSLLGVDHREHDQQDLEANLVSHLDQGDQDHILLMFGKAFEHSYSLRKCSKNTIQTFGRAFEHSYSLRNNKNTLQHRLQYNHILLMFGTAF